MTLELTHKKVTVLGAKRSGLAVAQMVGQLRGLPKISDAGPEASIRSDVAAVMQHVEYQLESGAHTRPFIQDSDLVVLSPGVRLDAPAVKWAQEKNIPVMGEIEFAWRFCPKPVIAVTGSNGKTTTVTLIAKILEKAGKKVCLCGNVGSAFSQHIADFPKMDYIVLEVSSFQLESIIEFKPAIAVFLNFSENHLDRHKDLAEYLTAKKRIFLNQGREEYAVLNAQDSVVASLAKDLKSQVRFFNSPEHIAQTAITNPNHLAALAVAEILGIPDSLCREVFKDFKGVEHRLEWVRSLQGVEYINDSKSTTAEATRWALLRSYRPLILICGGRDKNIDFSVLKSLVRQKVKKMIVIGEAREKLKKIFGSVVDVEEAGGLEPAVKRAQEAAREGDTVLLSPMCASFDMFDNYEHRGRVYKEIIHKLEN